MNIELAIQKTEPNAWREAGDKLLSVLHGKSYKFPVPIRIFLNTQPDGGIRITVLNRPSCVKMLARCTAIVGLQKTNPLVRIIWQTFELVIFHSRSNSEAE
ncbi:hypothetical protein PQR08_13415 [Caballeronia jiangsuensis]|uniref:Uncharacterized protein n=1 Tax=Caballeronia jiangsuensis TaxID=1458357 RepID=A0ABW9CLM6_9BURK